MRVGIVGFGKLARDYYVPALRRIQSVRVAAVADPLAASLGSARRCFPETALFSTSATVQAIPAYRLEPTDDTLVTFEERTTGNPEAVKRWFYPGELSGVAFVYPEDQR